MYIHLSHSIQKTRRFGYVMMRGDSQGQFSVLRTIDFYLPSHILTDIASKEISWDDLLTECRTENSVVEYIDASEQNLSMIAMEPAELINESNFIHKYTHCEIHPSTIFGILASCIPFPEHNQSPRNTYQCAMGKQAMGMYVTNYDNRMDKTAYVLTYPSRPLVDTRVMNMIELNQIPSGTQVVVAIMTHSGYNQEDSILFNKGSIDRGLFQANYLSYGKRMKIRRFMVTKKFDADPTLRRRKE